MKLTMTGKLSGCVLLAYRTPAESVEHLVPEGLAAITRDGFAFWNIVACRVIKMRPIGTPPALGMTYTHVAYRLYVQTTDTDRPMTGLYFVRSDVDSAFIGSMGDWFTDFRFHTSDIGYQFSEQVELDVSSRDQHADASFRATPAGRLQLQIDSCFDTLQQASAILKYQPTALSVSGSCIRCADVYRNESKWRESPLDVIEARWKFLNHLRQDDLHLEIATRVAPLEYRWQLGRKVARGRHMAPAIAR